MEKGKDGMEKEVRIEMKKKKIIKNQKKKMKKKEKSVNQKKIQIILFPRKNISLKSPL